MVYGASHNTDGHGVNNRIFYSIAGCAFLTYVTRESAENAQYALHEKITLPGVRQDLYFYLNYGLAICTRFECVWADEFEDVKVPL